MSLAGDEPGAVAIAVDSAVVRDRSPAATEERIEDRYRERRAEEHPLHLVATTRARRNRACAPVSTPSATTFIRRLRASVITASTT